MPRSIHTPEHDRLRRLLKEARDERGVTQQELADRLKRPQSFVSKVEMGERRLDLVELRELCRALGVDLVDLVRAFDRP